MEAEHSRLCVKFGCFSFPPTLLLLLKNSCVVFLLCGDHVVDDPGKLVCSGSHCLWGAHSSFACVGSNHPGMCRFGVVLGWPFAARGLLDSLSDASARRGLGHR
jgi:hypothetical protein